MVVRRTALNGWALFIACVFMVSVFVVVLKIMNPTEVHIFLEGRETVLSQVMRSYTLYDMVVLIAAALSAGLTSMYLLTFDRGLRSVELPYERKRASYERILPTLKEDEQKVFKAVLDSDGIVAQSELSELAGVSKSNVSRALDLLESRGYVERRRRGMGNIIVLQ
jgi:DNA-binding transcriptional ArsR family regulator